MQLAQLILDWYTYQGRKDLPWRQSITPYRIWLSEIMLQQTQVKTVIPYFEKFIAQFPTINILAHTQLDDVLHLWTGLGYYSRARHLHTTAKNVCTQYAGEFPNHLNELIKLPGIGRSTAGAILAIAFKKKAAILDGNVKRILVRVFAVDLPINATATLKLLWQLAEEILPNQRIDDYTQAIMDLGALICTRSNPKCDICPVQTHCVAFQNNLQHKLPQQKKKKSLPIKQTYMLILQNENNEILLQKREAKGIWSNLWSLPECTIDTDLHKFCQATYSITVNKINALEPFRHTFSHYHLDIQPLIIQSKNIYKIKDQQNRIWYKPTDHRKFGMPAPVVKLINYIFKEEISYVT